MASWPTALSIPCRGPVFPSIDANSTVEDVITPCLGHVILPGSIASFIITGFAFLLFYSKYVIIAPPLQRSPLLTSKLALSVIHFAITGIRSFLLVPEWSTEPDVAFACLTGCLFSWFTLLSYILCWQKGIIGCIWLHAAWAFHGIALIPEYFLIIGKFQPDFVDHYLFGIDAIITVLIVFLFFFADHYDPSYENFTESQRVYPDRTVSGPARLIFASTNSFIHDGYKHTLNYDRLFALPKWQTGSSVHSRYLQHVNRANGKIRDLFWTLIKLTKIEVIASILGDFCASVSALSDPFMVQYLVNAVENNYPLWYLMTAVICSGIFMEMRFLLSARVSYYAVRGNLDVWQALCSEVYRKMLILSSAAKVKYSAGAVVNLLTTDVDRVKSFWYWIPDYFYAPTMVILCTLALFATLGHNFLYGFAIILAFIPVNALLVRYASKFEERQMTFKDDRLKLMTDVLSGMKVLKLYAWENSMLARIASIRKSEVTQQKNATYLYSCMEGTFAACPILATIASFIGYVIIDGQKLNAQKAFLTLILFNYMRSSIYTLPNLVKMIINLRISLKRLTDFLSEDEVPQNANNLRVSDADDTVFAVKDATYAWSTDSDACVPLKELNFTLKRGELIGVIGRVGAGKSSFLSAICGELYRTGGRSYKDPNISTAFASQEPWIQNMTLKDNILFGAPLDDDYYRKTVDACALREDFTALAAGDQTEIGERGLNLSGGQKARVALARAVYQRAELYIMDDTLSAVDSHVGAHLFQHVIGPEGILKGTTRVFALNSIGFLEQCDRIIAIKDGNFVDVGTFAELVTRQNPVFVELVKELQTKQEDVETEAPEQTINLYDESDDILVDLTSPPDEPQIMLREHRRTVSTNSAESAPPPASFSRQVSAIHSPAPAHPPTSDSANGNLNGNLIEEEDLAYGNVGFKMYIDYCRAFGRYLIGAYIFGMFVVRTFFESASEVKLASWMSAAAAAGNSSASTPSDVHNLAIYGILAVIAMIALTLSTAIVAIGSYRASKGLHDELLMSLLRSPMAFFDRTPMGRILNRLSKDIQSIDNEVPGKITYVMSCSADIVMYVASAIFVLPVLVAIVIPVLAFVIALTRYYTYAAVQLRRLCSKSWSNVASHTQESYTGIASIRSFNAREKFTSKMGFVLNRAIEAALTECVCNRWISVRMDFLTVIIGTVFTGLATYLGHSGALATGSVALVMSTGGMLRGLLGYIARVLKDLEMSIVSVERVTEYMNNDHEAEWRKELEPVEAGNWPTAGEVKFVDFGLRYRENSPLVLKHLNLVIPAGTKVGIVGRTGAGKTSLTMALFRMIEPTTGTIFIDGIDFTTVGLHTLRENITIIPQEPVLFCGTLRENLDPFNAFDDSALWRAIDQAHLRGFVDEFTGKLEYEIGEGGGNLSVGQRQLVCLARAILRRTSRLLVLDEATAAVDHETDSLIQASIRTEFNNCTILTIAHRLNTILDYDKVLVMDAGEIREFDSPTNLLADNNSLFYALAAQAKIV
uniref:ABC transporter domain-containing protein n=1 Tax=Panagrellus redivivus TaxID=6233 RepID=A0A7E4UZL6_PANRE